MEGAAYSGPMREPLYLRGSIWWCRVRNPHGGRHVKASTGCRDRKAAVARWRELERLAFVPTDTPKDSPPLGRALDDRYAERKAAGRAAGTLDMMTKKGRHLTRLLGKATPLADIGAEEIDGYVSKRLKEGAERTTVYKELVTLRGALKLARRRGTYPHELDKVMPEFSAKYKPRTRALSLKEVDLLQKELPPKRAALVGFLIATAATYPSETQSLRKGHVDLKRGYVHLPGTKRETRDRRVPIVDFARAWVVAAVPYLPFEPWNNVGRDMAKACESAGIPKCCPTDLRRTMLTLLRAQGVEPSLLGVFAGHADSRMVERVYGRLAPEQLAHLLAERLTVPRLYPKGRKQRTDRTERTNKKAVN